MKPGTQNYDGRVFRKAMFRGVRPAGDGGKAGTWRTPDQARAVLMRWITRKLKGMFTLSPELFASLEPVGNSNH